jgi:hypothetical protein
VGNFIKIFSVLLLTSAMMFGSGCVSHTAGSPDRSVPITTSPSSADDIVARAAANGTGLNQLWNSTYQYPPDTTHWIQVDPIRNFQTEPRSDSTKLLINITGSTNLPAGSLLFIEPYRTDFSSLAEDQVLLWNVVVPVVNTGGKTNVFSYLLKGDAGPGEYRVVVRRAGVSNSSAFIILGKDPIPWLWIRIDPVGKRSLGENFNVTGTTNIPAGSEITVSGGTVIHPCPFDPTGKSTFPGSICGNSCRGVVFHARIPVIPGAGGNNTWSYPVNTTDWCVREQNDIVISKEEWDNVSPASAPIPVRVP